MNNNAQDIIVVVSDKLIIVNGRGLFFDFVMPEGMPAGIRALQWHDGKGEIETIVDNVPENIIIETIDYDAYVQPFVTLWEAEKYKLDNPPPLTLAEAKTQKLAEIKSAFQTEEDSGVVLTSLGWESDANRVARENIAGLVANSKETGATSVVYRDANNELHTITIAELEQVGKEVNAKLLGSHAKKTDLDTQVADATTVEAVKAIAWA